MRNKFHGKGAISSAPSVSIFHVVSLLLFSYLTYIQLMWLINRFIYSYFAHANASNVNNVNVFVFGAEGV